MPQNHARVLRERERTRRPLTARGKLVLALSGAVVTATVVAIILVSTGTTAHKGCINTYLPGVIGTQPVNACGSEARQTCATLRGQTQYGTAGVRILTQACRAGGLRVG